MSNKGEKDAPTRIAIVGFERALGIHWIVNSLSCGFPWQYNMVGLFTAAVAGVVRCMGVDVGVDLGCMA
ncbi:MAG: hypothetical protein GXO35_06845 [Gammaproteobacteria bacterium]|nr:hypothetical protein [Gammaproteobacteria bacterium]